MELFTKPVIFISLVFLVGLIFFLVSFGLGVRTISINRKAQGIDEYDNK